MPIEVKTYTIEELCSENKKIIIKPQKGVEIGIEVTEAGTLLIFYLGNELIKTDFNYIIKPIV